MRSFPLIASEPVPTHLHLLARVVDGWVQRYVDPTWGDSIRVVRLKGPEHADAKTRWIESTLMAALIRRGFEVYTEGEAIPLGFTVVWVPLDVSVRYTGSVRRSWRSSREFIRTATCRIAMQAIHSPSGRVLGAGEWVHAIHDTIPGRLLHELEADAEILLGRPEKPKETGFMRFIESFFMMALLFVTGYAFFSIRTRT